MSKSASSTAAATTTSSTSNFLSEITNSQVIVKLTNGLEYVGILSSIDGYMNVVLENSKEIVNSTEIRTYSEVFLRGNNVLYISQD
ncbi:hypothetical protein CANARDRAFT_198691 [[Candida] arabinofermentans NRRL YB-2248]|uniref:Sm domain-containing protein n=1 Tax=[Candida] arabinofermentans NRRL YB-2248 TaxID=983967 RepID=A0A1E4T185_9ASCO|nr:hypothetical protein CANARDRAFT_198691 [[Candida] arabinofermentans NRRL YB-2248]